MANKKQSKKPSRNSHNSNTSRRKQAIAAGYRSGLEEDVDKILKANDLHMDFEPSDFILPWSAKSRKSSLVCGNCGSCAIEEHHTYTSDFVTENRAVSLETKGRFTAADRMKMDALVKQHTDVLFIILFSNPNTRLSKKSKTTYSDWCNKRGIEWLSFKDNDWIYKLKRLIKSHKAKPKLVQSRLF